MWESCGFLTQSWEAKVNENPALWSAQAHMPSVIGRQVVIESGDGFFSQGRTLFNTIAGLR